MRAILDDTLATIRDQGEAITLRRALEEAITDWCHTAPHRYHLHQ